MNTNARSTLNTKGEITMIKKCYVIKERKIKDYLNSLGFPSIEDTNRNGEIGRASCRERVLRLV